MTDGVAAAQSPSRPGEAAPARAVALRYEGNARAPRIIASGSGHVAEALVERAREAGVPVAVEPALLEVLIRLDLDALVPPALYAAVAEVLAWSWRIDRRLAGEAGAEGTPGPGSRGRDADRTG
jgi:flagellar biosynthesis protein